MKNHPLIGILTFCWMLFFSMSTYSAIQGTPPVPLAPTGLTASTTVSGKVNLNWQSSAGATYYKVFRSTSATGVQKQIATPDVLAFSDFSATPKKTYYYWVKACLGRKCSPVSVQASGIATPKTIAVPANLTASTTEQERVSLYWDQVLVASQYQVFRDGVLLASPNSNSFDDTAATVNQLYRYHVKACDSFNVCSKLSRGASGIALPISPPVADDDDILDMIVPILAALPKSPSTAVNQSLSEVGTVNGIATNELDHILVAHYTDPFTLPQTKTDCIVIQNILGFKTCTGWASFKKVMNCEWHIDAPVSSSMRIQVSKAQTAYNEFIASLVTLFKKEIQDAIQSALLTSAVSSVVASIPSAGTAAVPTFVTVFGYTVNLETAKAIKNVIVWIENNKPVRQKAVGLANSAFPVLSANNMKQSCGWTDWKRI